MTMDCKNFDELYWLRAYGETTPGGEDSYQKHLESCIKCRARQEELDRFRSLLTSRAPAEAKPEALAAARERLSAWKR